MYIAGTSPILAGMAMAGSASAAVMYGHGGANAAAQHATSSRSLEPRATSSHSVSIVTTMPLPSSATRSTSAGVWSTASPAPFQYGTPSHNYLGVQGRGSNGPTNPDQPSLNTPINQSSDARLATLNSVEDWCTFGPEPLNNTDTMGDLEATTVAYCTKPRNNARVIPDGTVSAVQFVKTPLYIQLYAVGDFTNLNMAPGDSGGELDPHGATNRGNPVGGNVTSNIVDGHTDVWYEEWMNYISSNEICFRVCIAGTDKATPELECQHTLDEMGCSFVMAQKAVQDDTFESCESDAAYPPGLYPQEDGSTSTFQQFFSGVYTVGSTAYSYQNAHSDQVTPSAPYSYPTPSSCSRVSSISNGLKGVGYVSRSTTSSASSSSPSTSGAHHGSSTQSGANGGGKSDSAHGSSAGSSLRGHALLGGMGAFATAVLVGAVLL